MIARARENGGGNGRGAAAKVGVSPLAIVLLILPVLIVLMIALFSGAGASAPCLSDSDCAAKESCSQTLGQCYFQDFAAVSPMIAQMDVGQSRTIIFTIIPPFNTTKRMGLRVAGNGAVYTKFVGNVPSISVDISPSEARRVPAFFFSGAVGTYKACIVAIDAALPEINNTHPDPMNCATFIVQNKGKGVSLISTPSLGPLGIAFLAILASAAFVLVSKNNNKSGGA